MTKKTLVIILGMLVCLSSGVMAQKVVWVSDNQTGAFGAPTVNDQGFLDVLTAAGYTVTRELQTVREPRTDGGHERPALKRRI